MGKTFYSAILYTLQKLEVNAWQNVPTKGFLICGKEIPLCATLYSFPLGYLYPNRYSIGENKVYTSTLEYIKTYIPLRISHLLLKNDQLYILHFILFFPGLPFLSSTLTLQSMGRRQNSKHYFWTQSINFGKGRKKEKWTSFSQLHCWKLAHS